MTVRTLILLAAAGVAALLAAGPSAAQSLDYRGPALGRVSPAPSIYSNRTRPAYSFRPDYRASRQVCTIRFVREWRGDRVIERRVRTCRERW